MLEMASFAYARAPDVQRPFGRKHPLDEHRAVFAHAVVEQVAEHSLTCAHFYESAHAAFAFAILAEVGVNSAPMAAI